MASSYANHTYTQARNVRFSRCLWSGGGRRAAQKYKCPVGSRIEASGQNPPV